MRWPVAVILLASACSSGSIALGRLDESAAPGPRDGGLLDGSPSPSADAAACGVPVPARHYAFDGTGTEVVDLRGGPSGRLLGGAALDGRGGVRLDGVDDYVDLPNGLLAGLDEVTIAVWVQRFGGPAYTRVFDIGTTSLGEDPPAGASAVGRSYLALTPGTGNVPAGLAVLTSPDGPPNETVMTSAVDLDEARRLVVVTVARDSLSLSVDGALVARVQRPVALAAIVDHNAWLGRSQYAQDPYLNAEIADVRVWGAALPECAVRALAAGGPD